MPPSPRILIADNDAVITHLLSTMLQKKGYTIAGIVGTGGDALEKCATLAPDLVILDAGIAGPMDGVDAAYYLFGLFHVPVVLVAGKTDEARLDRLKLAYPAGVLFKPFTAAEVTTVMDIALFAHADRAATLPALPLGDSRKMMDNPSEAVIVLDRKGRIILLNTFAAWFVDIPAPEARMRYWRDVMMFVNDGTSEELPDPVADVIRRQSATIYDSGTAVVTRTSKRRKVLATIRPLRDGRDRFLAVLVSLREDVKKVYM
ncbi:MULTISPECIES: response regulator [unclassified Methanoregula]|uniref:response regulator n=1 Tax=unclassified Methanoregula TaxID=2649730 RepID=UPI0009CFF0F2|nr:MULTISPECIES: response regulator [unclassified Methanoregula]OPX64229.1 MAG: two-component response regulator [Methanoregula sp. PtaB.Bin085]OPY33647.1 MAG: two-component response regulator [Methanoregula sp. PtaU1.Bin006]